MENTYKAAILAGTIAFSWMGSVYAEEDFAHETSPSDFTLAYQLLRTSTQRFADPDAGRPFQLQDGSLTHIVYQPESAAFLDPEIDLSVRNSGDEDGVNACLTTFIKSYRKLPAVGTEEEKEFYQQITALLSPRYQPFLRKGLADGGYVLIHEPSHTCCGLFCTETGPLTIAQSYRTDICNTLHTIFVESASSFEDLDGIIFLLAHEMAHRAREHLLCEKYVQASESGTPEAGTPADMSETLMSELSKKHEYEADRIALLVLREERSIQAFIKKFAEEIAHPFFNDPQTGICYKVTVGGSDTHPSHVKRIASALDFWIDFIMHRDELSLAEAYAYVQERYSTLLDQIKIDKNLKRTLLDLV